MSGIITQGIRYPILVFSNDDDFVKSLQKNFGLARLHSADSITNLKKQLQKHENSLVCAILDANYKKDDEGAENIAFEYLYDARSQIISNYRNLRYFLLANEEIINKVQERYPENKVYCKNLSGIQSLIEELCKLGPINPSEKLRRKHREVFEVIARRFGDTDLEERFLIILDPRKRGSRMEIEDVFTHMRKIIEIVIRQFNKGFPDVIPFDYLEPKLRVSSILWILNGKVKKIGDNYLPTDVRYTNAFGYYYLQPLWSFCSEVASHLNAGDYYFTPYQIPSGISILCEVVLWYDEIATQEENKLFDIADYNAEPAQETAFNNVDEDFIETNHESPRS